MYFVLFICKFFDHERQFQNHTFCEKTISMVYCYIYYYSLGPINHGIHKGWNHMTIYYLIQL